MTPAEMAVYPPSIERIYLSEAGLDRCNGRKVDEVVAEVCKCNPRHLEDSRAIVRQIVARESAKLAKSMSGYEAGSGPPRPLADGASVWGDNAAPSWAGPAAALRVAVIDHAQNNGLLNEKNPHLRAASISQPVATGFSANAIPPARERAKDWNPMGAFLDLAKDEHRDLILIDRSDAETLHKAKVKLETLTSPFPRDLAK